jgi:hypothetical protein
VGAVIFAPLLQPASTAESATATATATAATADATATATATATEAGAATVLASNPTSDLDPANRWYVDHLVEFAENAVGPSRDAQYITGWHLTGKTRVGKCVEFH